MLTMQYAMRAVARDARARYAVYAMRGAMLMMPRVDKRAARGALRDMSARYVIDDSFLSPFLSFHFFRFSFITLFHYIFYALHYYFHFIIIFITFIDIFFLSLLFSHYFHYVLLILSLTLLSLHFHIIVNIFFRCHYFFAF